MRMQQHFRLIGTGHYLPRTELLPEDIDRRLGKQIGWTAEHSGVAKRRECLPHETLAGMACAAIQAAISNADVAWEEVDLLIDCSNCRQQPIPCNAALVKRELGKIAERIPCFDIQSTCLGFPVALQVANGLLAAGGVRTIVVCCAEAPLSGVNWNDPHSACLMSDAAAAVVVQACEPKWPMHFVQETYAKYADICQVRGGGHNLLPDKYRTEIDEQFRFQMDGPRLFCIARKLLPPMVNRLIDESSIERERLFVIPHQASPRAIESIRKTLGFTTQRYANRMRHLGNSIAASIPLVLDLSRREAEIQPGEAVMLLGTSAGYSQAAMIFHL